MNKITKLFFVALCILAFGQNIRTSSESKVGDSVEAVFMGFDGVVNLADPAVFAANPQWYEESPFTVMTAADIAAAHANRIAAAAAAAIQADYASFDSDSEEYEDEYTDEDDGEDADVEASEDSVNPGAEEKQEDSDTSGELIQENFDAGPTG